MHSLLIEIKCCIVSELNPVVRLAADSQLMPDLSLGSQELSPLVMISVVLKCHKPLHSES